MMTEIEKLKAEQRARDNAACQQRKEWEKAAIAKALGAALAEVTVVDREDGRGITINVQNHRPIFADFISSSRGLRLTDFWLDSHHRSCNFLSPPVGPKARRRVYETFAEAARKLKSEKARLLFETLAGQSVPNVRRAQRVFSSGGE